MLYSLLPHLLAILSNTSNPHHNNLQLGKMSASFLNPLPSCDTTFSLKVLPTPPQTHVPALPAGPLCPATRPTSPTPAILAFFLPPILTQLSHAMWPWHKLYPPPVTPIPQIFLWLDPGRYFGLSFSVSWSLSHCPILFSCCFYDCLPFAHPLTG